MDSAENTQSVTKPQATAKPWRPGRGAPPETLARNSTDPEIIARAKRSQVTNGTRAFAIGGVGNSAWTRRWKDVTAQLVLDLGGREAVSEFQLALSKRAAALTVELESLEAQMSEGTPVDLDLFGRLVGHLRRVAETLGIERKMRDSNEIDLRTYATRAYRLAAEDPQDLDTMDLAARISDAMPVEDPPSDEPAAPRVASPPDANPYQRANNTAPLDESPSPPAADPPTYGEPATAPTEPPAPPAIPSFARVFAGRDYYPPASAEPPSDGDVIPSNRPKANDS